MQKQQENNLCSKFIKNSLSETFCDNCGREEWYHPKENDYKIIFYNEGMKRASQHNFNQAEAGYNAKWFKRGGLFGYQKAKEENKDLIDVFEKMLNCLEQANFYQRKPDLIIQKAKDILLKTKCNNLT